MNPSDAEADDAPLERPSKTRMKREMEALQALGEELVALSADQLAKVKLPENLADAVQAARGISSHGARRRQMQFIGRLMRSVDAAPIQAQLDALKGVSAEAVARQHRLERLRESLLEDEEVFGEIARDYPGADLQQLRALRRNALREREQNKPPKAYRELFKRLRELDDAASAPGDA